MIFDDYMRLKKSLEKMSKDELIIAFIRLKEDKDRTLSELIKIKETSKMLSKTNTQIETPDVNADDMAYYQQRYNTYVRGGVVK